MLGATSKAEAVTNNSSAESNAGAEKLEVRVAKLTEQYNESPRAPLIRVTFLPAVYGPSIAQPASLSPLLFRLFPDLCRGGGRARLSRAANETLRR